MERTYKGIRIKGRLHRSGKIEARWTFEKKRFSCYGKTWEEAVESAILRLKPVLAVREAESQARRSRLVIIWLARDLSELYADSSPATREQAAWAIQTLCDCTPADLATDDLTLGAVLGIWREACRRYAKPNTRRTLRKFLVRVCGVWARSGITPYDYTREIKAPAATRKEIVPTADEAMRLWLDHRDHYLGPLLFCEFVLGMRSSEARSITLDMLGEDTLLVPGTKTKAAHRTIPLSPVISAVLHHYASNQERYLCANSMGGYLRDNITRDLRPLYAASGVPYAAQHGLRHAFATGAELLGMPRSVRMAIMGQSVTHEIGDLYVHPTPVNVRDWLTKWENSLGLEGQISWGTRGVNEIRVPK
ncbi:MAG: tyrosine-type recombinase/integrase [Armatimonadota bacterium]